MKKGLTKNLVVVLAIAFVLSACKQPTALIDGAKAAIEDVTKAGADKYAAAELKALNDDLAKATDEINAQDKKFFKKFGAAKDMLTQITTKAGEMKAQIPAKIEAAKTLAVELQGEAQTALTEAKDLLAKAPKGKGTAKDLEVLKADLTGAETAFAEIQAALDASDFIAAQDKAKSVKEKAAAIADQVKQAIEKVKK
jgi:DNA mismatch repair ATPase MutS